MKKMKPTKQQTKDTLTDTEILAIFDAKESGETLSHALLHTFKDLSLSEKSEVETFWMLHDKVRGLGMTITPPQTLAENVRDNTQISTGGASPSYQEPKELISSPYVPYINRFIEPMRSHWKLGAPIAILIFAFAGLLGMGRIEQTGSPVAMSLPEDNTLGIASNITEAPNVNVRSMQMTQTAPKIAPLASGRMPMTASAPSSRASVSEIVSTLKAEADGDAALLSTGDQDIALIASDAQAVNAIHNTYDETSF